MTPEEAENRWKETVKNIVRDQIRKLIQINITCPYCGKKYTIEELGKWEEGDLTNGNDRKAGGCKRVVK